MDKRDYLSFTHFYLDGFANVQYVCCLLCVCLSQIFLTIISCNSHMAYNRRGMGDRLLAASYITVLLTQNGTTAAAPLQLYQRGEPRFVSRADHRPTIFMRMTF